MQNDPTNDTDIPYWAQKNTGLSAYLEVDTEQPAEGLSGYLAANDRK